MAASDPAKTLRAVRHCFLEAYGFVNPTASHDFGDLFRALNRLEGVNVAECLSGEIKKEAQGQARRSVLRTLAYYIDVKTRKYSSRAFIDAVCQVMRDLEKEEPDEDE